MNNNDVLEMLNDFMETDLIIKRIISNSEPKTEDGYNEESIINYQDKLFKALKNIESEFNKIIICFEDEEQGKLRNNSIRNQMDKIFKAYKDELLNLIPTFDNLKKFYKVCFANMNKELIFKLREECKGYYMWNGSYFPDSYLKDATSLSDILHIFHVCFMNNEYKYQAIPVLEQKPTEYNEEDKISLRGVPNETAKQIYDSIPEKVGITDIVAFPNGKIIMMLRDVGHATTIEIDNNKEDGRTWIRYFIPKICNLDMVKKIDGCSIHSVDGIPKFAEGSIDTKNIAKDVTELIEKIPTDEDMFTNNIVR